MQASKYQQAIYQHFESLTWGQEGHTAIVSVAGSGKTTVKLEAIKRVDGFNQILAVAFNKDIKLDSEKKLEGKKNVDCLTYNGFGARILYQALYPRQPELVPEKTSKILEHVVSRSKYYRYVQPMTRIVSLFKNLLTTNLYEVAGEYGIDLPDDEEDFEQAVQDVWQESLRNIRHIDWDDQKFLPIHYDWLIPRYDNLFVDEFQDTCPVEMELVRRASNSICAIGDPDQSIYGFKGANPDAFDQYMKEKNPKVFPLSVCYRCSKSVIREAQKIVPRIEAWDSNPEGSVTTTSNPKIGDGDFVLCRTTAPLIKSCLGFLKQGRKAHVRGREIGDNLLYLIDKCNQDNSITELVYRLEEYKRNKTGLKPQEEANLQDRVASIIALSQDCGTVEDLKKKINTVFVDRPGPGIDHMTAHKSKGLQARNVFVLHPELLPHPAAKLEHMKKQEMCLKYVVITRAMENLTWITT